MTATTAAADADTAAAHDAGVLDLATSAGYLTYGLMALTVCFGMLTTTGWARHAVKRQTLYGAHMMLAIMTLTSGVLHGLSFTFQQTETFTYLTAFVPFLGGGGMDVALGTMALELGIVVAVSVWAQRLLGYRRWHMLHYAAYAAFGLALAHAFVMSQDVQAFAGIGVLVVGAAGAVGLMFLLRLLPATRAVGTRIAPQEV
ncbi:ferric reductase-like transmembrane domain-containing protein [Gandjariella thermophila]|nr:ferric reductase-like transmembrane domain-containing protein [Gandjariella thermophila]